ncbi:MAG: dTMP kinase [Proteobacteria bacterium]|nr:dTMP kinase [Pseudomonadota bacterium]MDA1058615.1 dTMP kinase [Pseudomonadota bacterium]
MAHGRFITFEGGEGAGKSTQVERLGERLRADGHDVLITREPGGAPGALEIRRLLVEGAVERWEPVSELLLHNAARHEHVCKTIAPALAAGVWVVCDRFADSTVAYQGYGQGVARDTVARINALGANGVSPDLTIILDLAVADGLARAGGRADVEDRYERMGADFHERIRAAFLDIARAEPDRCAVIAAAGDADQIAAQVWDTVRTRLSI